MSNDKSVLVDDKLFIIKVTYEGIIVDVYTEDGEEFIDSPFAATWAEMLPDDDEDKVAT